MSVELDVQREVQALPDDEDFRKWVEQTLSFEKHGDTELTIRIVGEDESAELNEQYRKKTGPTNVLSFPFEMPAEVGLNLLGDLVICAPVVEKEAKEQHKEELAHWAHMVVHGTLHLLGYDHIIENEAKMMEEKEVKILSLLEYSDPYRDAEL
ncbi:MAG: rRNA maturation RNase YbeY [Gammaproteobacteria bacterium]|nr:rRNA maturation RNase YbeY [Gammaproteobacteria bacterium]